MALAAPFEFLRFFMLTSTGAAFTRFEVNIPDAAQGAVE
jgi:hypothetical protein